MNARQAQRIWRRLVQLAYWIAVTQWAMLTGRFFVFRNAPTWFVRLVARQKVLASDSSDFSDYIGAARDERAMRRYRTKS